MIIWLLHLLLVSSASAQEPVWQRVTRADGLDTNWVRDLYQGPDHRIVMGTSVGVFAWDGDRARRIDGGRIRTEIQRLERFGDGLVARDKRGRLWSIDGDRTRQVQANGVDLTARDMAWTDEGLVYVANDRSIWVLKPDESARQLLPSVHDARRVWRAPGGWIFATSEGWFRTQDGQTTSLKHRVFGSEDALVSSDGTVWLADGRGVWTLSGPGPPVLRLAMDRTRVALAERNQSVWAAGEVLARFSGTEVEQSWTAKDGYRGRGEALMVDHEGGLWAGSGQGAAYVAEPSLVRWAPKHGLADRAPRRMAWHQDALWVSHWNGFSAIRDGEVAVDEQVFSPSEPCADMQGSVWFIDTPTAQGGAPVLRSVANDDRRSWPVSSGRHFFEACHADENQEVWLTAGDRLLRAGAGQWTDAGPLPKPKARGTLRALHVHDGVASYSVDTAFCQMRVEELETAADWRCVDVGGDQHIMSIARDEHGQFWVVGTDDTVLVGGLDGW
ncbi:MAG: hypothetical protein AB8H79_08270, partial [Myxococcota bacterium]